MYDWRVEVETVGVGTADPQEELRRLDEQIQSAAELAALKPIFYRLNEIMQASPDDFDVQLAGNDIKQHMMARGALLKQQGACAPPPAPPLSFPLYPLFSTTPPPPEPPSPPAH